MNTLLAACCTLTACGLSLLAFVVVVAASMQSGNISQVKRGAWPMAYKKKN